VYRTLLMDGRLISSHVVSAVSSSSAAALSFGFLPTASLALIFIALTELVAPVCNTTAMINNRMAK